MFEYVTGYVEYVGPEYVVIDHNGIGYQIFTPNPYVFQRSKQEIRVYTYHYVREDIMALYGFKTREERLLFTKLLGVSGIGPKGADAILQARRRSKLRDLTALRKLGIVVTRVAPFVLLDGKRVESQMRLF